MAKEIKQKIVLEGEKEYSAKLKEANRNLKTLQSQLKAETAELGKNATAQDKASVKAKSFQEQIKEQEKIVKTLQDALKEVQEKYADNADEIARWEQKVNMARATLANMRNDLSSVGDAFGGIKEQTAEGVTATNSLAESIGRIASVGDSLSGAIEGIFSGMFDRLTSVASKTWELIAETAAKANNWTDLGSYYGSDASAMQLWNDSIQAAQGSFEDFIQLVNQFSFGGKNKKITEWFGISDANYTDKLEYTVAVLGEMAKRRDEMMKNGTWDDAMNDIFGAKRSKTASWFVSNWENILKEQQTLQEHGFEIKKEDLSTLNDVYVSMGEIETKWEKIKQKVAAGLGTTTLSIMTNVSGALDAISELLEAKPGSKEEQAALDKLTGNIREACEKAARAIEEGLKVLESVGQNLSESDNPYVAAIGNIITSLTQGLDWIIKNQELVINALKAIFGAWLIAKLGSVAGKLTEIVTSIKTVQAFKDWKIATGGGAGTGTGSGTPAVVPTGTGTGTGAATGAAATKFSILPNLAAMVAVWEGAKKIPLQWGEAAKAAAGKATDADKALAEYNQEKGIETLGDAEQKLLETSQEQNRKTMGFMLDTLLHPGKKTELTTAAESPEEAAERKAKEQAEYWASRPKVDVETGDYTRPHNPRLLAAEKEKEAAAETVVETGAGGIAGAAAQAEKETEQAAAGISSAVVDMQKAIEEIVEELEISDYTDEDREAAFQDWWDAYRNNGQGLEDQEEVDNAFDRMATVFEDDFADVFYNINKMLDQMENAENMSDLPSSWWREVTDVVGKNQNPITRGDLNGVQSVLASLGAQVQIGAARGVSGIQVTLDGAAVGRMVAPYVSQYIAYEVG